MVPAVTCSWRLMSPSAALLFRLHEPPANEKAAQADTSQHIAAQWPRDSHGLLAKSWPGKSL